jgi:hypothetical protein
MAGAISLAGLFLSRKKRIDLSLHFFLNVVDTGSFDLFVQVLKRFSGILERILKRHSKQRSMLKAIQKPSDDWV